VPFTNADKFSVDRDVHFAVIGEYIPGGARETSSLVLKVNGSMDLNDSYKVVHNIPRHVFKTI
jgi:hypothetical protein